ncbi:MAG TPA: HxsD-like protein [Pyrinomonadaceae bacterium]|jgi:hypothetical protein
MSTRIALSSTIYPQECLRPVITAYQGLCSVRILDETLTGYSIEISPEADLVDEKQLADEFLNYLLDLSLEKHLTELQEDNGTDRLSTS